MHMLIVADGNTEEKGGSRKSYVRQQDFGKGVQRRQRKATYVHIEHIINIHPKGVRVVFCLQETSTRSEISDEDVHWLLNNAPTITRICCFAANRLSLLATK